MFGTYWVQLTDVDNWNNYIESNKFNVTIKPSTPFAQTNTIQSINVYANHYTEVQLPDFLFYNKGQVSLNLQSSSWVHSSNANVATRITEDIENKSLSLFVKVFGDTGWQISIFSNSSFCQSSEFLLDINVLKWASKEWHECVGPYESDWISCKIGFVLNTDGSWTREMSYFPIINNKIYWIWGLFAMIVTLIHILLAFRYGKIMLEPAMHLQTLMLLVLSLDWVSDNWREYLSWIQFFKFDLSFLNSIWLNRLVSWTLSTDRFANAELYWEEMILYYINLIVLISLFLLINKIIKKISWKKILIIIQLIDVPPETQFWVLCSMILPFFSISIYNDLTNFKHHMKYSVITSLICVVLVWYWVYKKRSFWGSQFMQRIHPYYSLSYTYLSMSIRIPLILLFILTSQMISRLLVIIILIAQSTLLFSLFQSKGKLPLQQNFTKATEIFGNSVMLLITMIISVNIVRFIINITVAYWGII